MSKIKIDDNLFINQSFITNKKIRPGSKFKKISITIHGTGNPRSTAKNERDWLSNPTNNRIASWHYAVDDKEVWQAIPVEETAYHAGNATGNTTSIGIEICESGNRLKTLQNAIKLVKFLQKEYKIDKIVRHFDWTKKDCPRILINKNFVKDGLDWKWFIAELEKKEEVIVEMNWKQKIVQSALDMGLITDKEWLNKTDEKVEVWFVLVVVMNAIKIILKK